MSTNHHSPIDGTKYYNKSSDIEAPLSDLDQAITDNASAITGKADTGHTHTNPYDIGGTFIGVPGDGVVLLRLPLARAVVFPTDLTDSRMIAAVAATAETIFSIKKNGTEFGTATFAISGTVATLASGAGATFAAGDILTLVAPGLADATLADLGWVITGTR